MVIPFQATFILQLSVPRIFRFFFWYRIICIFKFLREFYRSFAKNCLHVFKHLKVIAIYQILRSSYSRNVLSGLGNMCIKFSCIAPDVSEFWIIFTCHFFPPPLLGVSKPHRVLFQIISNSDINYGYLDNAYHQ